MPKAKELTDSEKSQIDLLHELHKDWSHAKIAEAINRNRSTVSKYLKNPEKGIRTGRPKITTERVDREIVRLAKRDKLSCAQVKNQLGLDCCNTTVYNRLRSDQNTKFGKHQSKPVLTAIHKQKRLEFAVEMISANRETWNDIIFTDEKKWNLDGPDGLKSFWYDIRKEKTIFSKRQGGGKGVMVWAGFANGGTTEIAFCQGKMNSDDYQDILANYLLPVGPLITSGDYTLMQDNAPIHRSKSTKDWLEVNEVKILPWPALSPDLNPIENLWGWMTRQVCYGQGRQFRSIPELKTAIVETWSNVPSELRESLIGSMKNRMLKVIQAKGGSIDY
uniref:Tc1-like transposase DDE domain-containing protein n=1 Tax=Tetranychus urticae TaxID=32264 RepID=A0A158P4H4_TETUR